MPGPLSINKAKEGNLRRVHVMVGTVKEMDPLEGDPLELSIISSTLRPSQMRFWGVGVLGVWVVESQNRLICGKMVRSVLKRREDVTSVWFGEGKQSCCREQEEVKLPWMGTLEQEVAFALPSSK